jgi:hypothetical protein
MDEQVVQTVLFGHAGGGPPSGYASRAPLPARRPRPGLRPPRWNLWVGPSRRQPFRTSWLIGKESRFPATRDRFCWMGAQAITADVSGLRRRRMVDARAETEGVLVPGERHSN